MLSYMDHVQQLFDQVSGWSDSNAYQHIVASSQNLLDFGLPQGTRLTVSSQSSKNTFSSYTLGSLGLVNGSLSYLYSSAGLDITSSANLSVKNLVPGYKIIGPRTSLPSAGYLMYGRLHIPSNRLEAMLVRQMLSLGGARVVVKCVSDSHLKNDGALTVHLQKDTGLYQTEFIYSTHETLLGLRGVYNVGYEEREERKHAHGNPSRLTVGGELFYGLDSKSPGMSTGLRYTTQSAYTGTPLTVALVANPLMGHLAASYALRTTAASSFATRFDFNIYSYISDLNIGCEIAQRPATRDASILKASVSIADQALKLLWQGRFHDFLVSAGVSLRKAPQAIDATVGLELHYSS